jgi:hypothetical protein
MDHRQRESLSSVFVRFRAPLQELENLLSLYDDDAEHFSPKLKPTNQKQMAS